MESLAVFLPLVLLLLLCICFPVLLVVATRLVRHGPNQVELDPAVRAALPRVRYSEHVSAHAPAEGPVSCAICLADYASEDLVLRLPCHHIFHEACGESWLKVSQCCPICRTNLSQPGEV